MNEPWERFESTTNEQMNTNSRVVLIRRRSIDLGLFLLKSILNLPETAKTDELFALFIPQPKGE